MSLRMRRVAAGSSSGETAALRPEDRVALRLHGRVFALPWGKDVIAGRSSECAIVLGDRLCSREHAAFSRTEGGGATVRDLGSTNGTYVNGVRIRAAHALAEHDWITLGNETLELCIAPPEQSLQPPTIPAGRPREPATTPRGAPRSGAKTDPAHPLLSLASFAATAAGQTPSALRADVLKNPLDLLLQRVENGDAVQESDAQMAAIVALHLTRATGDGSWIDYVFRLYSALRQPMSSELIERLGEALGYARQPEFASFRAYLDVLGQPTGGGWDETQQRLIALLSALHARSEERSWAAPAADPSS